MKLAAKHFSLKTEISKALPVSGGYNCLKLNRIIQQTQLESACWQHYCKVWLFYPLLKVTKCCQYRKKKEKNLQQTTKYSKPAVTAIWWHLNWTAISTSLDTNWFATLVKVYAYTVRPTLHRKVDHVFLVIFVFFLQCDIFAISSYAFRCMLQGNHTTSWQIRLYIWPCDLSPIIILTRCSHKLCTSPAFFRLTKQSIVTKNVVLFLVSIC